MGFMTKCPRGRPCPETVAASLSNLDQFLNQFCPPVFTYIHLLHLSILHGCHVIGELGFKIGLNHGTINTAN
jgi:hypothetical protein